MDLIVKILGLFKNKGCFIKIERMLNGNCYSSVDRGDWLSTHEELVSVIFPGRGSSRSGPAFSLLLVSLLIFRRLQSCGPCLAHSLMKQTCSEPLLCGRLCATYLIYREEQSRHPLPSWSLWSICRGTHNKNLKNGQDNFRLL